MKSRILIASLIVIAFVALWLVPGRASAARVRQPATDTPPPTGGSCLTLPPEQQSGCFATKVAAEELVRQTQEVIGITATAQAVEQQIQGTLAAAGATPTHVPTIAVPVSTPQGFSVVVPGLDIRLNLLSLAGLAVCAAGGIVLIILGIYLVRGNGGDEEDQAPPAGLPPSAAESPVEVRALFTREPEAVRPPAPPVPIPPAPSPLEAVLAAAPTGYPALVFDDSLQIPLTSGDFSIGRASTNDFVVDGRFPGFENVSAEHARLVQDASGRWLIEDLGSANGTWVNDRPTTMNVLRDGWRVSLASVQFTFRLPKPEEHA